MYHRALVELLKAHAIEDLVDVRTVPRSKDNPQFGMGELTTSILREDIASIHLGKLGSLWHTTKDSLHLG
jgi:uncharacterized protein (DUF488 family)